MLSPAALPPWLSVGKVAALANALFAVLIGVAAARLSLDLLPDAPSYQPTATTAGGAGAARRESASTLAGKVAKAHLFGVAGAASATGPTKAEEAPETRLNLTLKGVLAFEPQSLAMAIISAGSAQEKIYAVGEKIVGQARLAEVYPDRVIIERAGVRETLRLPENLAALGAAPDSGQDGADAARTDSKDLPGGLPSQPSELRDHLVKNPAKLAQLVAAQPYRQDGRLMGYKLSPKGGGSEFLASFGVFPDDIITQVNGIALTSQKRGIRALRKLIGANQVELTVLRNGAEVPVSISLQ